MKSLVFIVCLLFNASLYASSYMLLPIDEVYDGDTIFTHIANYRLPSPLNLLRVRINGIDTPEMPAKSYYTTGKLGRAKCVKEAELAIKSRLFLISLIDGQKKMKISNYKWGTYGGRIVADVTINGKDIAEEMLTNGHAVYYDGKSEKTHDWCK